MSKLILLIGFFIASVTCQVWREPVIEQRLRPAPAYPRPTIVEAIPAPPVFAPRYVAPLGYDNYGNANVEHPYAYLNDETGASVIEDEITHSYNPTFAPTPVFAPQIAPVAPWAYGPGPRVFRP